MSSSSTTSTFTSLTTTLAPNQTGGASSNNDQNNPSNFYKNLFYILIGLLAAFGIVSFLSLLRARRRRHQIIREAERLGVVVPGMEGYVPLRERQAMNWTKADGSQSPDWWEVGAVAWGKSIWQTLRNGKEADPGWEPYMRGQDEKGGLLEQEEVVKTSFLPLALIPKPTVIETSSMPIPLSTIPYFPNHLAFRPESLAPIPSRFQSSDPTTLNQLSGESIDIVTIIRMPVPEWKGEMEEGEEVLREWAGVEFGIVKLPVESQGPDH